MMVRMGEFVVLVGFVDVFVLFGLGLCIGFVLVDCCIGVVGLVYVVLFVFEGYFFG